VVVSPHIHPYSKADHGPLECIYTKLTGYGACGVTRCGGLGMESSTLCTQSHQLPVTPAQTSTEFQRLLPRLSPQSIATEPTQQTHTHAIKHMSTKKHLLSQSLCAVPLASTRPAQSKSISIHAPETEDTTCSILEKQLQSTTGNHHATFARPLVYQPRSKKTVAGLPISGCTNLDSPSGRFQSYTCMTDPLFQS
jgi:hypothetical protein